MGYKVCVYAICKNEIRFARRWYESMREADDVFVLDTGSTDGTAQALEAMGARVRVREIRPWRFDDARNESMKGILPDADICVCTDLDEVFEPGWCARLKSQWRAGARRAIYLYTWSFRADGSPGTVFWADKIHARQGYRWEYPVHEALAREDGQADGAQDVVRLEGVRLNHYPDAQKSRGQYLELLKLAVHERPMDARAMHYLGREYMYAGDWARCIQTLQAHLLLPGAVWKEERCASLRYLAFALLKLGDADGAKRALFRAIGEAPHLREAYLDLARLLFDDGNFAGARFFAGEALHIQTRPDVYISEESAWNGDAEALFARSGRALAERAPE